MRRLVALGVLAACQRDPAPQNNAGSGDVCGEVALRLGQALQPEIDAAGSSAKPTLARTIPTMRLACIEDRWPATLTQCIVASKPGDATAARRCSASLPKDLQDKLQRRMLSAPP